MIRFWGRTHPQDTPYGPPVPLYVLSEYFEPETLPQKQASTSAFATYKADFAIMHFTLRLFDGKLIIESVTLFTDDSKRSNRNITQAFEKKKDNIEQDGGGQPATRPESK